MPSLPPPAQNPVLKKFCLSLEELRRTGDGRVRSSEEFVAHFFPHDDEIVADQIFKHLPREIRGPILSGWGIRGPKTALKDDDQRVEEAVHDALRSGDLDAATFEGGLPPQTIIDHLPLAEWWMFWRTGSLTTAVVQRAVLTAKQLGLFDADWFLANLTSSDGQAKGIDVFAARLSKAHLTEWVAAIAQKGEASSEGVLGALGWERLVEHTSTSALLVILDSLIKKVGLEIEMPTEVPPELASLEDVESTQVQSYADRKSGAAK